jgi:hypothetical protein
MAGSNFTAFDAPGTVHQFGRMGVIGFSNQHRQALTPEVTDDRR